MASAPIMNEEKKPSWPSQASASWSGGSKVSLSCSEEFLTRISAELTDEALCIARCMNPGPPVKEKQTKDQGTQISRHAFFTNNTRSTDTRADKNRTRNKAHLLPSPREKGALNSSLTTGG
ncbi:putative protein T-ENOL isoform X2 [Perognathus longimembris pacificus]|uniref:putative protein T-ENOL isoform X2 n=1 Tax=Perognathus longimembris pacificus TaxID=214514 RepID=UPI00201871EF|nr:putative protein T-ENOL isoform X2 [Perognathus longimembris pacificus]